MAAWRQTKDRDLPHDRSVPANDGSAAPHENRDIARHLKARDTMTSNKLSTIDSPEAAALAPLSDRDEQRPVLMHLASLSTDKSRRSAIDSLKRIARAGKYPDWQSITWRSMNPEQTTFIRARLLERPPRGLGFGPETLKLTLSTLRSVLKQARKLHFFSAEALADMVDWPALRASTVPRGRSLTDEEIRRLRAFFATQRPAYGAFLRGVFAVLLGAGARREEVSALDASALHGKVLRILGKGRKERNVPLPSWALHDVRSWLVVRRGLGVTASTFFVRVDPLDRVYDWPLSAWSVWSLVAGITEEIGIEDISTHDLRRTYASHLMETVDMSTVQGLMGHAQMTTTARYDRRGEKAAAQAVKALEKWGDDE